MLHVGGGQVEEGGQTVKSLSAATCHLVFLASLENAHGELPKYSTPCSNIYHVTQTERNTEAGSRRDQAGTD